jgi:YggT family protein
MVTQALIFMITSIGGLFALALLLRFLLQLLRAPPRNQLSEFLAALTDFIVRPVRRVVPGWGGLDLSTLVLAWATEAAQIWLVLAIRGYEPGNAIGMSMVALAALAALELAKLAVYIVMAGVIMQALLSWFGNPSPLIASLTRPILRPLQRRVPPIANVDITPIIVLLICQLLLTVPFAWLERVLSRTL